MILESIDFTDFYAHIRSIFSKHFSAQQTDDLMEFVDTLSDANFRCYKANMIVIASRKDNADDKLIADMEWVARSVGEYRVSSKARINKYISTIRDDWDLTVVDLLDYSWRSDDVVYSIGEMMDRLSIEFIKREDFRVNNRAQHMTNSCQALSDRVDKFLHAKLEEIDKKGFYECVHEQRTYDLEGIVQDLVI
jgi:hypothetical protein